MNCVEESRGERSGCVRALTGTGKSCTRTSPVVAKKPSKRIYDSSKGVGAAVRRVCPTGTGKRAIVTGRRTDDLSKSISKTPDDINNTTCKSLALP